MPGHPGPATERRGRGPQQPGAGPVPGAPRGSARGHRAGPGVALGLLGVRASLEGRPHPSVPGRSARACRLLAWPRARPALPLTTAPPRASPGRPRICREPVGVAFRCARLGVGLVLLTWLGGGPATADHSGTLQLNDRVGPYVVSVWTQPERPRTDNCQVGVVVMEGHLR